jgi:hypothetical protein
LSGEWQLTFGCWWVHREFAACFANPSVGQTNCLRGKRNKYLGTYTQSLSPCLPMACEQWYSSFKNALDSKNDYLLSASILNAVRVLFIQTGVDRLMKA